MKTVKFPFRVFGHGIDFFLPLSFYWEDSFSLWRSDFCRHLRFTPHITQILAPYFTYCGPQSPGPWLWEPITPTPRAVKVHLQACWSCFQFLLHFWDLGISLFLASSMFCLAFLRICSGRVSGSLSQLFWQKPQVFYVMCMYMHIFIYTCMHLYMFYLYLNLLYFLCILQTCIYMYCSCCCSVAQLYSTLCDPMDCSTSDFPVLHHLWELAQTLVH